MFFCLRGFTAAPTGYGMKALCVSLAHLRALLSAALHRKKEKKLEPTHTHSCISCILFATARIFRNQNLSFTSTVYVTTPKLSFVFLNQWVTSHFYQYCKTWKLIFCHKIGVLYCCCCCFLDFCWIAKSRTSCSKMENRGSRTKFTCKSSWTKAYWRR